MASTTAVIEMPVEHWIRENTNLDTSSNRAIPLQDRPNRTEPDAEEFRPGGAVVEALERWDRPRINRYRLAAIFFAFLNFGMNDGSYGALVPYVCSYTCLWHLFLQAHKEMSVDRGGLRSFLHRYIPGLPFAVRRLHDSCHVQ